MSAITFLDHILSLVSSCVNPLNSSQTIFGDLSLQIIIKCLRLYFLSVSVTSNSPCWQNITEDIIEALWKQPVLLNNMTKPVENELCLCTGWRKDWVKWHGPNRGASLEGGGRSNKPQYEARVGAQRNTEAQPCDWRSPDKTTTWSRTEEKQQEECSDKKIRLKAELWHRRRHLRDSPSALQRWVLPLKTHKSHCDGRVFSSDRLRTMVSITTTSSRFFCLLPATKESMSFPCVGRTKKTGGWLRSWGLLPFTQFSLSLCKQIKMLGEKNKQTTKKSAK